MTFTRRRILDLPQLLCIAVALLLIFPRYISFLHDVLPFVHAWVGSYELTVYALMPFEFVLAIIGMAFWVTYAIDRRGRVCYEFATTYLFIRCLAGSGIALIVSVAVGVLIQVWALFPV